MQYIELPTSSLSLKEKSRLGCMYGCVHYKRNPMCPPLAPNFSWFSKLTDSYEKVRIYFEYSPIESKWELAAFKNSFHKKLIEEENGLKKKKTFKLLER